MSEETTTEPTEKTPEQSFAELRTQRDDALSELRPFRAEKAVTEAGFPLDSPEGKALRALALREDGVDADKVKNLAEEFGFETPAPKVELTPNERAAQEFANRQADLGSVTTSDEPPDVATEVAELEAAGKWAEAGQRKLQQFIAANQ
jgi:hypothetical protein